MPLYHRALQFMHSTHKIQVVLVRYVVFFFII